MKNYTKDVSNTKFVFIFSFTFILIISIIWIWFDLKINKIELKKQAPQTIHNKTALYTIKEDNLIIF